jgi:protein-S-isoprenylcysteine O-methyltransferase Ste14
MPQVPAVILIGTDWDLGWGLGEVVDTLSVVLGLALAGAGSALWIWTVRLFAQIGRGTLAPWDPPLNLVVEGPYRHVRNPMIAAVLAFLAGEVLLVGSPALLPRWLPRREPDAG